MSAAGYYTRLALYAEAEQNRKREEKAKVDARTRSMLNAQQYVRAQNTLTSAKQLRADVDSVIACLESGMARAAGLHAISLTTRAQAIDMNLGAMEIVEDVLEILASEDASE